MCTLGLDPTSGMGRSRRRGGRPRRALHVARAMPCRPALTSKQIIDYVVPDDMLEKGKALLRSVPLVEECPLGMEVCRVTRTDKPKLKTTSSFHAHHRDDVGVKVELYKQSDILWGLAPFPSELSRPQSGVTIPEDFVLSTDFSRLPDTRWHSFSPRSYPVVMPNLHRMTEAWLRIYAREMGWESDEAAETALMHLHQGRGLELVPQLSSPFSELWEERCLKSREFYENGTRWDVSDWRKRLTLQLGEVWDPTGRDFVLDTEFKPGSDSDEDFYE